MAFSVITQGVFLLHTRAGLGEGRGEVPVCFVILDEPGLS